MYEEALGKELFVSIAAWFFVVTAQIVLDAPRAEQIASVPQQAGSAVG